MSTERKDQELSYTSEFPKGWEVEWKGNLVNIDPADLVYALYEKIAYGKFGSYKIPPAVGTYPLSIRYFDVLFHFYGHKNGDKWFEDVTLAQFPNSEAYFPRVKTAAHSPELEALGTNVNLRIEVIKEDIRNRFTPEAARDFIKDYEQKHGVSLVRVGTIRRDRYSFYATNNSSNRNWGILADRSQLVSETSNPTLYQAEIEYRTKLGPSEQNLESQTQALMELEELGNMVVTETGAEKVQPTKLTKFDWIVSNSTKLD